MAEHTIEYSARLEPNKLAAAERVFYLRSLAKLQLWRTVLPPIGFACALLAGPTLRAGAFFFWVFGIFLVLSILRPIVFWCLRPLAVAADARKFPNRKLRLTDQNIHMSGGIRESALAWSKVRDVWDTDAYLLLVVSPLFALHLPKDGMPDGTREFIASRTGTAI